MLRHATPRCVSKAKWQSEHDLRPPSSCRSPQLVILRRRQGTISHSSMASELQLLSLAQDTTSVLVRLRLGTNVLFCLNINISTLLS